MRSPWSGLLVVVLAAAGSGCASKSLERGRDFLLSPLEVTALAAERIGRAPFVCLGQERRSEVFEESVYLHDHDKDGTIKEKVASESGLVEGLGSVAMIPFEALALLLDRFRFASVTPFGTEPSPSRVVESVFKDPEKVREAEERRKKTAVATAVDRPPDE